MAFCLIISIHSDRRDIPFNILFNILAPCQDRSPSHRALVLRDLGSGIGYQSKLFQRSDLPQGWGKSSDWIVRGED